MSHDKQKLDGQGIEREDLADWRIMFNSLHARFRTGDFATGLRLLNRIGEAAEAMGHHPDLDLSYRLLNVRLTSHDVGGLTRRDVRLARTISELAAIEGVASEPAAISVLEIGLDTADHTAIKPFWAAVLGLVDSAAYDEELVDPDGALTTLWFQEAQGSVGVPDQRFHLDLRVPPEVAPERIAAALDAGGTLVDDEHAPAFWVLADPQGNKVCVCTWQGRG